MIKYPRKSEALRNCWRTMSQEDHDKRVSGLRELGARRTINRVGQSYGDLTVVSSAGKNKHGHYMWNCSCVCGGFRVASGHQLRDKRVISCRSCALRRIAEFHKTHGKTRSPEYAMLMRAKSRAVRNGVEFDLTLDDVVIPVLCPVFGTPLALGTVKENDNSPSLDRVNNKRGYVRGNVWVISKKANMIKNNGTLSELKMLVSALERRQQPIMFASGSSNV